MAERLVLCDCRGSMSLDADGLSRATGLEAAAPCAELCGRDAGVAQAAIRDGGAVIGCAQEAARFESMAADLGADAPITVDLRDRAGWSDDGAAPLAKMGALVADARRAARPDRPVDVTSDGLCLVLGGEEVALRAAARLAEHLPVTVLLAAPPETMPDACAFDVVVGDLRNATGSFGRFSVRIDALRQVVPGGRAMGFTAPRDGATSTCDVIVDLRRDAPLFPAPTKRDGYLRADPGDPYAVGDAILAASHMAGTFEKTLHVRVEPVLCAHSRAGQTGCTRCLDLCPTGAITPDGDHVAVDAMVCAGCGACSAACPSGAISYDAPPVDETIARVQALAAAYRAVGGTAPRLLVHDPHGAEMIRLAARHGRGLPAGVVPMEMPALAAFGHAEALAGLAAGFASVHWLPGPDSDRETIAAQAALTTALGGAALVHDVADPDDLSTALFGHAATTPANDPIRPMGTRRQVARQAAVALSDADVLALPEGAPYGAVLVDTDACTLCLSCVSLCPSGALGDNPDRPQLRFQEDACLQCGLCANICPEAAITLEPRMDLTPAALRQRVLHEEEPAECVECGAAFGVASTIEKIAEKLSAHAMFAGDRLRMIRMCDDCRVRSQMHGRDAPFAGAARPAPRTTMDELAARGRRDH